MKDEITTHLNRYHVRIGRMIPENLKSYFAVEWKEMISSLERFIRNKTCTKPYAFKEDLFDLSMSVSQLDEKLRKHEGMISKLFTIIRSNNLEEK
jgi:hypothetical protein